jgi:hypothetical protein
VQELNAKLEKVSMQLWPPSCVCCAILIFFISLKQFDKAVVACVLTHFCDFYMLLSGPESC